MNNVCVCNEELIEYAKEKEKEPTPERIKELSRLN